MNIDFALVQNTSEAPAAMIQLHKQNMEVA